MHYVSLEKERQWLNKVTLNEDRLVLGICLVEDNRLIGTVNMQDVDLLNRSCHVPIMLGEKEEWNKGYATEARMLMLNYVFNERGMERVWAKILEHNVASIKMHEKCGYKTEGIMRHTVFKDGRWQNQILMSILRDEFLVVYEEYSKLHFQ